MSTTLPDTDLFWIDGTDLPLQGRGFADTPAPYHRLPARAKGVVPDGVWRMGVESTGLSFRFRTDSDVLHFRWKVADENPYDRYMGPVAMAGLDIYGMTHRGWRFVACAAYRALEWATNTMHIGTSRIDWTPGRECMVYLPLRSDVQSFSLGIRPGSKVETFPRLHPEIAKPVVHYGTSIVHGGCVSRPGLAFANQEGRALDLEVINLGFSGMGRMEHSMCDLVADIDAALYIVDCDWNMSVEEQKERYEPFVRRLAGRRPGVPILLCGGCTQREEPRPQEVYARSVFDKLKAEGPAWNHLHFLPSKGMLPTADGEATFDFCHPNDWGSMHMGRVYADAIRSILLPQTP